jgi:hypothetical protein
MPSNTLSTTKRLPPIKKYLNLREVIKDLNILSSIVLQAAPKLKKPIDPFENEDFGSDIILNDKATKRLIPDVDSDDVVDTEPTPKIAKNVIKPTVNTPKKRVIKEDNEPALPGENTPAIVDKEIDDFEKQGSTFNYTDANPDNDTDSEDSFPEGMESDEANNANLKKWNDELAVLFHQRESINNIINTLSHSFANTLNDSEGSIKAAIANAKLIQQKVKDQINSLRVKISNSTELVLPPKFRQFTDKVYRALETKYKDKYQNSLIVYQGAPKSNGAFQLSSFIVFTQFKDENNEVLPNFIIAISVIGKSYYINPSLLRMPAIGSFTPGYIIHNRNEAIRYIEEQLSLYGSLDTISTVPTPPALTNIGLTAIKDVIDVKFGKYELSVQLKSSNNAKNIANEIYSVIYSYLYQMEPKVAKKLKIRYDVFKKDNKTYVVYKFTKVDGITNRTLQRDEIKILQNIFTDEDIHKIEYVLNSNAKNVTRKAS